MPKQITTVLFDLDGTLVDTAPDLAFALNRLLHEEAHAPLAFEHIRNVVSNGSGAMVEAAFGPRQTQDPALFERRRERLLAIYADNLHLDSRLFPGMEALLAYLEKHAIPWGVVTNKPAWLTDPLMQSLGLEARAACVVSGDTTEQRKPHPLPMHHACELIGAQPGQCLYVGDAQRDIEAGKAALMHTLVALYGYIDAQQQPQHWGADGLIREPREILDWMLGDTHSGAH